MQMPQILDQPRSQITPFRQKCPLYSGGGEQPQVERCKPLAKMMGNHLDTMDNTNVRVDDNSKLQTPNTQIYNIYIYIYKEKENKFHYILLKMAFICYIIISQCQIIL